MSTRLIKNAGFSTAGYAVNMVVSILFVPAYIYFLGIDGYGIYSFLLLIFSWITILQAGIDPAVIRMAAKYVAEDKHIKINSLITISLVFQMVIASLIGIVLFVSSEYLVSFIVKDEIGFIDETRLALSFAAINVVLLMSKNIYVSLFKGLQRYDISSIYESFFNLLASVVALFLLWLGYGISGMIFARLALNILSIIVLHKLVKRIMPSFQLGFNITKELIMEIYNYASWIVVGRVNRLALNALPPIIIGMHIGPSGIAYFSIASKIVTALNNLLASSINVIFPFVSELKTLNETTRIKSLYLDSDRLLSLISTPLYCFGAIYSWDLLYVWLGHDIADNCWMLMALFFVGYYLTSSTMIPCTFALGMGNSRILAINGFVQTLIVVLFLPLLMRTFELPGAGLNLILFETASIVTGIIITTKIIKASAFKFWVSGRLQLLLATTCIFLAFIPIKNSFSHVVLTRVEAAIFLCCVLFVGLAFYGVLIKSSNLIDRETKRRIVQIFKRVKQ